MVIDDSRVLLDSRPSFVLNGVFARPLAGDYYLGADNKVRRCEKDFPVATAEAPDKANPRWQNRRPILEAVTETNTDLII